jgi:hypothetical protein
MSRSADFTIKGFLYQFNKSLIEILNSGNHDVVTVEGVAEDVEVLKPGGTTAIQCKYHEASECFTPSSIYKPVLQMMLDFIDHPSAPVRYVLFGHYPGAADTPSRPLLKQYLQGALDSGNRDLQGFTDALRGTVRLEAFLDRFALEFGPTLDSLVDEVCAALEANGIPKDEIDTLAYPNAINMIATISANHNLAERKIKKQEFLDRLKAVRKTAVSRWTMALRTRKQLLEARRKQLKAHLSINPRIRYFVIHLDRIENHDEGIVLFIKDYLDKYHFKQSHIYTPLFCLCATEGEFADVRLRLFQKGITVADGYIGDYFDKSHFFREPLCVKRHGETNREFWLRLLRWEDHSALLNERKCDDLFILGEPDVSTLITVDVEVEQLTTTSLKELKFLMGVSDAYE